MPAVALAVNTMSRELCAFMSFATFSLASSYAVVACVCVKEYLIA